MKRYYVILAALVIPALTACSVNATEQGAGQASVPETNVNSPASGMQWAPAAGQAYGPETNVSTEAVRVQSVGPEFAPAAGQAYGPETNISVAEAQGNGAY